jgi:hypothetical protein
MLHLSHVCPFTPYEVGGGGSEWGGVVGWNTRGKRGRIPEILSRSQNIANPKVRLIIIENRSKQTFLPDQIREHFGL